MAAYLYQDMAQRAMSCALYAPRSFVDDRDSDEVAHREHSDDAVLLRDREVPEAAVDHQHRGMSRRVRRLDRLGMRRHAVGDREGLDAARRHRRQHVALGEDAAEAST